MEARSESAHMGSVVADACVLCTQSRVHSVVQVLTSYSPVVSLGPGVSSECFPQLFLCAVSSEVHCSLKGYPRAQGVE